MIEKILERLEEEREIAEKELEKCIFKGLPYHDSTEGKIIGIKEAIEIVQEVAKDGGWIPVTYHVATDEEREEMCLSDDITYILDCPMPEDEQEIIVCSKSYVWTDTCIIDDGYSLDSSHDWCEDIVAWMPMPKKYEPKKQKGE